MKTISIFNYKGGVAKTVSTINIGSVLAKKCKKVLLIDMDPQSSLSSTFNSDDINGLSIGNLLLDKEGNIAIKDVLVNTDIENIDLLPCNTGLTEVISEIESNRKVSMHHRLKKVLDRMVSEGYEYDYCIIDCPPSDGIASMNALVASDEVLIPVSVGKYGYKGIGRLIEDIKDIQTEFNPNLTFKSCFITMADHRTKLYSIVREMLEEDLDTKLAKTSIRKNVALEEATFINMSIIDYQENSISSQDYQALVKELFNV